MPTDDLHGPTDENIAPFDLPLLRLMGPQSRHIRTLEDLWGAAGSIPVLLQELIDAASATKSDRPDAAVRLSVGRTVNDLGMWIVAAAPGVLAGFNGHPEFSRIHSAVDEVRTCVDCLCSLAYDYACTPSIPNARDRYQEVAALLRGAVDDLHLLIGLSPLAPTESLRPGDASSNAGGSSGQTSEFIVSRAQRIRKLVTQPGGMEHFRDAVVRVVERHVEQEREVERWHAGWDRPESPTDLFWPTGRLGLATDGTYTCRLYKLAARTLTPDEQLTVLGLIHDAVYKSMEAVNPFAGDVPNERSAAFQFLGRRHRYERWLNEAARLIADDMPSIDAMIANAEPAKRRKKRARAKASREAGSEPPPVLYMTDDGRSAVYKGKKFPLTEAQGQVLGKLIEHQGTWVTGNDLKQFRGSKERPDRIIRALPSTIRRLTSSRRGLGFCLRLA